MGNVWWMKSLGHKLAIADAGGIEAMRDALKTNPLHNSLCSIMRISSVVLDAPEFASPEAVDEARKSAGVPDASGSKAFSTP